MAIGLRIRREREIILSEVGANNFAIFNKNNKMVVDASEDYFIYFKDVEFLPNGIIKGRYLGENPKNIIDEKSKKISYVNSGWRFENGRKDIKSARMVAVENKTGVIIIIES